MKSDAVTFTRISMHPVPLFGFDAAAAFAINLGCRSEENWRSSGAGLDWRRGLGINRRINGHQDWPFETAVGRIAWRTPSSKINDDWSDWPEPPARPPTTPPTNRQLSASRNRKSPTGSYIISTHRLRYWSVVLNKVGTIIFRRYRPLSARSPIFWARS